MVSPTGMAVVIIDNVEGLLAPVNTLDNSAGLVNDSLQVFAIDVTIGWVILSKTLSDPVTSDEVLANDAHHGNVVGKQVGLTVSSADDILEQDLLGVHLDLLFHLA